MRAILPLGLALGLVACGPPGGGEFTFWQERRSAQNVTERVEVRTDQRVIDAANALSPAEESRLDRIAYGVGMATDRKVLVLTVPPLGDQSLEQFGWAINGQRRDDGTMLLMVRPDERTVRVESGGAVSPEQAAAIAAAMAPLLAQRQTAGAVEAGLSQWLRIGART